MTVNYLITHSGSFHGDDVSAAAVLTRLFPDAAILRTRDETVMDELEGQAIIFDVGRVYDADRNRFDHHMRGARERENGVVFSSFGLIWDTFGRDYLRALNVDEAFIEPIFAEFDAKVVLPMDMIDTGSLSPSAIGVSGGISMAAMISTLNPPFDEAKRADARFAQAVSVIQTLIEGRVESMEADLRAEKIVEHEVNRQWGNPILMLNHGLNFQPALDRLGASHVMLIVTPSTTGGWGLSVARKNAHTYDNLIDLPEAWAGLSGQDLVDASGIPGLTFCHSGKFYAAGDTKDSILAAAEFTLAHAAEARPSM